MMTSYTSGEIASRFIEHSETTNRTVQNGNFNNFIHSKRVGLDDFLPVYKWVLSKNRATESFRRRLSKCVGLCVFFTRLSVTPVPLDTLNIDEGVFFFLCSKAC